MREKYTDRDYPLENEVKLWTVATGNFNPRIKSHRKAIEYIPTLNGFEGVHPTIRGTLWLFDSENAAKIARNQMEMKGIRCGTNICPCFVEKQFTKSYREKENG